MEDFDDYFPCYKKGNYEKSAIKQLLALSPKSYPGEYGDTGFLNTAVASSVKVKKRREKTGIQLDDPKEVPEKTEEPEPAILTSADIYQSFTDKEYNCNFAFDFCSWQLCPTVHAETVKYGLSDSSRLKPRLVHTAIPPRRSVASASSKLNHRLAASPSRLKTCHVRRSQQQQQLQLQQQQQQRPASVASRPPSSSSKREEVGTWQEPPPPVPIQYSFKYLKHPRQYSDQYREVYTYTKMKEAGFARVQFVTGVAIPRARNRCVNGKDESRARAATGGGKHLPSSTATTSDPSQDQSSAITWQLNQQLLESCDVALSVNNPSPTEIAMLSKIPHIHRSSPSIPSNTNGKYGGKGTDKPYPFQLNISADAQTVIAPSVKKVGRTIYIH